jgi:hypothetical protein
MNADGAGAARTGLPTCRAEGPGTADGHNEGRGFADQEMDTDRVCGFADQAGGALVGSFFQGLSVEGE